MGLELCEHPNPLPETVLDMSLLQSPPHFLRVTSWPK